MSLNAKKPNKNVDVVKMIEDLYRSNRRDYVKIVYNRAGGLANAEDVVQEAFYRTLKYKDTFDTSRDIEKWFGFIINNALKDIKKADRLQGMGTEYQEWHDVAEAVDYTSNRFMLTIKKEIDGKSSEGLIDILKLYFLTGHTPKEICQILDVNYTTVRTSVMRFKNDLISKYGDDVF